MLKNHILLLISVLLVSCSASDDPYKAYQDHNYEHAKVLLEPLVDEGDPKAMTYLAAIHQIYRDYEAAEILYTKAAKKNFAPAQYNLGILLHDGRELERHVEHTYAWFYLAAEQGHEKAKNQLQRMVSELTVNQVIRAKKWARDQLQGNS